MSTYNEGIAHKLWNAVKITFDRPFKTVLSVREQVTFLGFADVTVDASETIPGLVFTIRGIECKILKGNAHIDMPSHEGKDGKFYPDVYPRSAELRKVMTVALFNDAGVKSAIEAAKSATPAAAASGERGDNPFQA